MKNRERIKEVLKKGEHVMLECKRAKSEVPKSVWETYSAFANTMGGFILLGIEEDRQEKDIAKRFKIIGVDDATKIVADFWNTINSDKVNANVLKNDDVEIIDVDGADIVSIHIPQADWRVKPVYLNGNVYKGTYRRNHEGDFHCTELQVRAMIRDSFDDGNDGMLLDHYGMEDVDIDTFHRYRTLFQYRNEGHVWNEADDISFLKNLGGYTVNRATGDEGLTMAGLLMFGKGMSVQERFANFRMDYIDFSNLIGDERYSDRLTYDGRWENNLFQFFSIVLPKLTRDLPRPFRMEGVQRVDDTPQHKAVREALTNAIIHSDMLMDASVLRVEKYEDKLCFRNPGLLKLPIEMIYEGGNSKARNPRIQNMLRMIGYGENIGSGFPTIISAWKDARWGKPILKNKIEVDEVELILPITTNKTRVSKGVSKGVSKETIGELSSAAKTIFELINNNPNVSRNDMAKQTGVSLKNIQKNINKLKQLGLIRRVGSPKHGHWEVLV